MSGPRTPVLPRTLVLTALACVAANLAVLQAGSPATAAPPAWDCATVPGMCTETYSPDEDFQHWTVPDGVTSATFTLVGAAGGVAAFGDATPGAGGSVTGTVATTPGVTYRITPGGVGGAGTTSGDGIFAGVSEGGIWGGGSGEDASGGGGGASRVEVHDDGSGTWSDLLVAGGGGGAGRSDDAAAETGGAGGDGGEVGAPGGDTSGGTGKGGGGGTAAAGGAGGTATDGVTTRTGRSGSDTSGGGFGNMSGWTAGAAAAGGGEGRYGGGQGTVSFAGLAGGGGGGGSSHADPSVTGVSYAVGTNPHTSPTGGNGYISITYADPNVVPPAPEDVYVTIDGTDTGDCAVEATACATLAYAYEQAADTATVHIGPGEFESATFAAGGRTRSVVFQGNADGEGEDDSTWISIAGVPVVTEGIDATFRDLWVAGGGGYGFRPNGGSLTLERVTVNAQYAAVLASSSVPATEVAVRASTLRSDSAGVIIDGADKTATITGSTLVARTPLQIHTGAVTLTGTILAGAIPYVSVDCYLLSGGAVIDGGYNIADDASCNFTAAGSQGATDPVLGVYGWDAGGPTPTHRPALTSPAVDQIPPGTAGCPATTGTAKDQTGAERLQGGACDIGAVEQRGLPSEVYVATDGADTGDCASAAAACATLAYAYNVSAQTATVHIGPGSFSGGTFDGDRNVVFEGNTGAGGGTTLGEVRSSATDVTFRDLTGVSPGANVFGASGGKLTLARVTASGASGVYAEESGAQVVVRNSTVNADEFGILAEPGTQVTVRNSTIRGASFAGVYASGSAVTMSGSILFDTASSGSRCLANVGGSIVDGGYNLADDASCALSATGSRNSVTDLAMGSLADNGGPTSTYKPAQSSPAVNLIPAGNTLCTDTDKDQTGAARLQGSGCDAGAVEQSEPPDDVYIAASGTDAGDCATAGTACATLTYAYGQVADDGTVHVGAGTATSGGGSLTAAKTVDVVGDPAGSTIDGQITVADNATVRFRDLTLRATGRTLTLNAWTTLERVTVIRNDAVGPEAIYGGGTVTIRNSTVTGGGVRSQGGTFFISSSTIVAPVVALIGDVFGAFEISGSIVSGTCSFSSGGKIVDEGYNVERGCGSGANKFTAVTTAHVGDVALRPLGDNGGPTQTFLPKASSPAVDRVPPGTTACPAGFGTITDQTGAERRSGAACNAGSVEEVGGRPTDVYVELPENGGDDAGNCSSPDAPCESLYYAYQQAAATATIHVGPGLFGGSSTYSGSGRDVTIVGHPDGTRIPYLYIYAGNTPHLTVRDVNLNYVLSCSGVINLERVLVTSTPEWVDVMGPNYGIRACGGTVNVRNSTFSGLSSAVYVDPGTTTGGVAFIGSTIAGISGWVAEGDASLVTLTGSIVADAAAGACADPVNDGGHNLVDDDTCVLTDPSSQGGVTDLALGALGDHGGPTATFRPAATSPAVDLVPAGVAHCPATVGAGKDQTGAARFQGAACDVGAVEQARLYTVTFDSAGGSAVASVEVEHGSVAAAPTAPTRTGYTFGGWFASGSAYDFATPVTDALTLTAQWELNLYTVDFDSAGGSAVASVEVGYGAAVAEPTDPTRAGYTFVGWFSGGSAYDFIAPVTGDLTLTAQWAVNRYTVTFDSDGGSVVAPVEVDHGDAVAAPASPTRAGYGFVGWFDGQVAYDFAAPVTGDLTLTAQWEVDRYTVSFDSDGGSAVAPVEVDHGDVVAAPAAPTRGGYTFVGWFSGGSAYDFATPVTGDLTLTAQWAVNRYTVTFDSDGGSVVAPVEVDHGDAVASPTAPTRAGYTFAGWFSGGSAYNFASPVTGDLTLTAQWELNRYTVTFDSDGGSVVAPVEVDHGDAVAAPASPTRAGYGFVGWSAGGAAYDFATPVTGDLTLTAQWALNRYTVSFDSDGGSAVAPVEVDHGDVVAEPADPTRAGYTFAGWSAGGTAYDFATSVTGDLTLTAQWAVNRYTVTFDSDGGSAVAPVEVDHGDVVAEPTAPTRSGHTFVGWFAGETAYDFTTSVTDDLTLTAHWEPIPLVTVTVDFREHGGSTVADQTVAPGTAVARPADPTRAGHGFAGWWTQEVGGTEYAFPLTVTADVVLHAQWTVNRYTVTFDSAGGSAVAPVEVTYGAAVAEPAAPVWEGHTFLGWYDGAAAYDFITPVTAGLTLTARWQVDRHEVTFDTQGGSAVATQTVDHGTPVPQPADPRRDGYSFTGWYTTADGGAPYQFATLVTGPLTVYAHWVAEGDLTVDAHPVIVTANHFDVRCHATRGSLRSCAATVTTVRKGKVVVLATGEASAGGADANVRLTLTRQGRKLTRPALGGVPVTLRATGVLDNGLIRHAERSSLLFAPKQARKGANAMFGPDGDRLTAGGKRFLDRIARKAEQVTTLTCIGHTAKTGNRVGNRVAYQLSLRRAKAACAHLVRKGVKVRVKVRVVGVGNTATRKGSAPRNRFVDVVVRHS